MKTCPACAEQIQEAAILCRHCRTRLDGGAHRATRLAQLLVAVGMVGLAVSLVAPALRPPLAQVREAEPDLACPALAPGRWLPPGHPPIDGRSGGLPLRLPPGEFSPPAERPGIEGVREL